MADLDESCWKIVVWSAGVSNQKSEVIVETKHARPVKHRKLVASSEMRSLLLAESIAAMRFLLVCNFCCIAVACLLVMRGRLRLDVADDVAGVHVTHIDIRHANAVSLVQRCGDRVLFFQQLI